MNVVPAGQGMEVLPTTTAGKSIFEKKKNHIAFLKLIPLCISLHLLVLMAV